MRLGALKSLVPPLLVAAAAAWLGHAGWTLHAERAEREIARALAANRDVTPPDGASGELLFARAHFLLVRDRIDEAQALSARIVERGGPELAGRFHYNVGNARSRRAIGAIEASQIDRAIPEVRLAKEAYRSALRADPALWDARYNLDVAMRLVRDFPELEAGDEEAQAQPKKLWTDLPGRPRGLP
jgi:mxaK protein